MLTGTLGKFKIGQLLIKANLLFSAASAKIIPGATSLLFRNNADTQTNVTIADAGAVTIGQGVLNANAGLTLGAGSNMTSDSGTASATAGAATLNKQSGTITSEALTTAAAASYTLTLTNSVITAASRVFVSADNGTNTQGELTVQRVTPSSGQVVIVVKNTHATQAYNGTIKINFFVML